MKPLMDGIDFIGKYQIYRPFKWCSRRVLNGFGHLFGKFLLGSGSAKYKAKSSLKALYPNISSNRLNKLAETNAKYLGSLMVDATFRLPGTTLLPLNTFFEWENLEILDEALSHGKGVIIVQGHIGHFFHSVPGLVQFGEKVDPNKDENIRKGRNKYLIGGVAQMNNLMMYINCNRDTVKRLYIYASTGFRKISNHLIKYL
ncbi:MAG: hypothetical protein GY870_04205, partial [archaeon]|nr:hypothetical protein [archaeon]